MREVPCKFYKTSGALVGQECRLNHVLGNCPECSDYYPMSGERIWKATEKVVRALDSGISLEEMDKLIEIRSKALNDPGNEGG